MTRRAFAIEPLSKYCRIDNYQVCHGHCSAASSCRRAWSLVVTRISDAVEQVRYRQGRMHARRPKETTAGTKTDMKSPQDIKTPGESGPSNALVTFASSTSPDRSLVGASQALLAFQMPESTRAEFSQCALFADAIGSSLPDFHIGTSRSYPPRSTSSFSSSA